MKCNTLGELLYWSYANLQMMDAAQSMGLTDYNRTCFIIRSKAYKAYKDSVWHIHDLLQENVAKMRSDNTHCAYCNREFSPNELTIEHIFPRIKGGTNDMDNILLVCSHCNSSKGDMDVMEWYATIRRDFPPKFVLLHYLKQINNYAEEHHLLETPLSELNTRLLPFDYKWIPTEYPKPTYQW